MARVPACRRAMYGIQPHIETYTYTVYDLFYSSRGVSHEQMRLRRGGGGGGWRSGNGREGVVGPSHQSCTESNMLVACTLDAIIACAIDVYIYIHNADLVCCVSIVLQVSSGCFVRMHSRLFHHHHQRQYRRGHHLQSHACMQACMHTCARVQNCII